MTLESTAIQATINYCDPTGNRPLIMGADLGQSVAKFEPHRVRIEDVSRSGSRPTLDEEGYLLVSHASKVRDFQSQEELRQVYTLELETLIQSMTGADHAKAQLGITRRAARRGDDTQSSGTVHFPHIDASDRGILDLIAHRYPEQPTRVARWAYYNTWRALSPAPLDQPLAVCDARSVNDADMIPYDSVFPDVTWESLMLRFNPDHRWAFYSDMGAGDLLVFKTHDFDRTKAHAVAHTAFQNPLAPEGTVPRVSLECRVFACWYD